MVWGHVPLANSAQTDMEESPLEKVIFVLPVQVLKYSCEYGHHSPLFLLSHREKLYGAYTCCF